MNEKATIKNMLDFIDKRIAEGATETELDKLYDDLQSIQMNCYVGDLFEEDE